MKFENMLKYYFLILVILVLILLTSVEIHAADVPLEWDAVTGAESYAIEHSVDQGTNWIDRQDAGGEDTIHTYTNTPEDALVLFRVMALGSGQEAIRTYSGAWYDHRLRPLQTPGGAGIP